jgi:hypothetical protein
MNCGLPYEGISSRHRASELTSGLSFIDSTPHTSGIIKGVAAIYNRYEYGEEAREALMKWGDRLHAIVVDRGVLNRLSRRERRGCAPAGGRSGIATEPTKPAQSRSPWPAAAV